jgi:hypothetical protein
MRVQTMFGRIASGTNERLFGPAFVLMRVSIGAIIFFFGHLLWQAAHGVTLPATVASQEIVKVFMTHGFLGEWVAIGFMFVGVSYVLGLLTRPSGILLIALLVFLDVALLPLATMKMVIMNELFLVGLALLGVAGGIGNAFGLNGIILRNIRSHGKAVHLLFS